MSTKLIVALAFVLVALLTACENGDGGEATPGTTPGVTVSPQLQDETPPPGETPTETPAETPTALPELCQPNPDPATPEFQLIDQPSAGDIVTSPVTISGRILSFEATYQIGIFDIAGNPIMKAFGTAEAMEIGELAPFSIEVTFDIDEPTPACIWVYEASATDGSPIHVGQIPVILAP